MSKPVFESNAILCKIGKTEHIEQLLQGKVYMKNIGFHRKNALENLNLNTGDEYEGIIIKKGRGRVIAENGKHIADCINNDAGLNEKYPIFCAYKAILSENGIEFDERLKEDFTSENIDDYSVLVMSFEPFEKKCSEVLDKLGLKAIAAEVQYKEQLDIFETNDLYKYAFQKKKRFEYQQEYRILVKKEVEDDFALEIDDLSKEAFILSAKVFFNPSFELQCQAKDNEV